MFFILRVITLLLIFPNLVLAKGSKESALDQDANTLFVHASYGFSTYKSKSVESNDTGATTLIDAGAHIGENKKMFINLIQESATHAFELNSSSITTSWQDVMIGYRLGWVQFGVIVSSGSILVDNQGTETSQMTASGYGAGLNLLIPIGNSSVFYTKVSSVSASEVQDAVAEASSLGSRMDIDIGSKTNIARSAFELIYGYRMKTYTLTIDGTTGAESHTNTYIGMGFGIDF